jgi:anti-anti-sigma factor
VTFRTKSVNVTVSSGKDGDKIIVIAGVLDAETLTEAWGQALEPLRKAPPSSLEIDVSQLKYCDGAGLGLFSGLRRMVSARGGETKFVGVRPDQQRFLGMSVLNIADKAGANAMPVVSLLGLLIGLILAFQTATPLQRFGAQPIIPTIVAIAVVREMGPLITAVLRPPLTTVTFSVAIDSSGEITFGLKGNIYREPFDSECSIRLAWFSRGWSGVAFHRLDHADGTKQTRTPRR